MEYDFSLDAYTLQPNEVLEIGHVRVTNISKKPGSVTAELMREIDRTKLTGGPMIENGLEFRLR